MLCGWSPDAWEDARGWPASRANDRRRGTDQLLDTRIDTRDDTQRRRETMAMVRSITITTTVKEDGKEAGAVSGHRVEARVEVGGEERVYDLSNVNPRITSLVEQLVSAVHQETLQESRPEMQRVLDAEKAFEQ
jgi:hypothetical protein